MSVFRQKLISDNTNFLYCVRIVQRHLNSSEDGIIHILAIKQETIRLNATPIRRKIDAKRESSLSTGKLAHAGNGKQHIKHIAVRRDREFRKAAFIESRCDLGSGLV